MSKTYSYAIGSVHDLPLGSLTYIEDIVVNGAHVYPPQGFGFYSAGLQAWRGNGVANYQGYPSTEWKWTGQGGNGWFPYAQATSIKNTFLGGNWSGTVTVYTKTDQNSAYALYNATATIYQVAESGANFKAYTRFGIRLSHMVAR